jgi:hypothetical protein
MTIARSSNYATWCGCAALTLLVAAGQSLGQTPLPVRIGEAVLSEALDLSQGLPAREPTPAHPQETQPQEVAQPQEVLIGPATPRQPASGPPDLAAAFFDREPVILQRTGTSRVWAETVEPWEAPALCHRPLYFEDESLERFGRSYGLAQPAVSAAHFAGRIAIWPYLAGAFGPHECIYTLGRGRPGTYTPYGLYRPPVSARGALYQAGAVAGLAYLVP